MDDRSCDSAPRRYWLPLCICLISLAPYWPLLWPNDHVLEADDYQSYQLPTRQFAQQELFKGRFPLWMPSVAAGTPLHAGQQDALTYPLLVPFLLLPSVNYGLRLCLFAHLLLGYWGQFLLGRRFALSLGAAALGALVTTLSGFALGHLLAGHLNLIFAQTLIPWFFLTLAYFLAHPGPLSAASLAFCVALLLLLGHPQLPYYALLLGTVWGLASWLGGAASQQRLRVLSWTLVAALVALLLVLVQWLPALELIRDGSAYGPRGQADYFDIGALRPPELLILAVPNATGNPYAQLPMFMGSGWRFHEKACYVGLLPLGLAVFGFTRRRVTIWQWSFLCACSVCLLIALGNGTPVMGWLTHLVPGLTMFRAPARILGLATVLLALLAGRGFDDLLYRAPPAPFRRQLGLVVTAVTLLLGVVVSCFVLREVLVKYATYALTVAKWEYALAAMLSLASFGTVLLAIRLAPQKRVAAQLLLMALLVLDLWVAQARFFHLVPPDTTLGPDGPPAEAAVRYAPMDVTNKEIRYSSALGILSVRPWSTIETNEGGVLPASYERLKARFLDPNESAKVVRMSACTHRYDPDNHRWKHVLNPLPRVRLASPEDVAEFSAQTGETRFSPNAGDALVLTETPQDMTVRVRATAPTMLIVADCYFPGWQADVDGQPESVEPVHGIFRGVPLAAGEHEVRFRYVSWPFRIGLLASGFGWITLLGLFALGLKQRRSAIVRETKEIVESKRAAA